MNSRIQNRAGAYLRLVLLLVVVTAPLAAGAGDTWANLAELGWVGEEVVVLGDETYRTANGIEILDVNGLPLSLHDLADHTGAMVVFSAKWGSPTPWVTRIALQRADTD